MAILRPEISFNFKPIADLIQQFPSFSGRFLALVGSKGRKRLKAAYLSGQEINLSEFPKDKLGRYTITSDVNRRRTQVKIYSYPVNLFELGRTLRDGRREPGKRIITRKLKADISAGISGYVREFEDGILKDEIKKIGAS